jgi:hypothetical protein
VIFIQGKELSAILFVALETGLDDSGEIQYLCFNTGKKIQRNVIFFPFSLVFIFIISMQAS